MMSGITNKKNKRLGICGRFFLKLTYVRWGSLTLYSKTSDEMIWSTSEEKIKSMRLDLVSVIRVGLGTICFELNLISNLEKKCVLGDFLAGYSKKILKIETNIEYY